MVRIVEWSFSRESLNAQTNTILSDGYIERRKGLVINIILNGILSLVMIVVIIYYRIGFSETAPTLLGYLGLIAFLFSTLVWLREYRKLSKLITSNETDEKKSLNKETERREAF